jgi:hypothetical protein
MVYTLTMRRVFDLFKSRYAIQTAPLHCYLPLTQVLCYVSQ